MSESQSPIAVIQMQSGDDVARNLERTRELCRSAAATAARLLVLPENFAFFGSESKKAELAEPVPEGPISTALAQLARELSVTIVGGGHPETSPDPTRPFNTQVVFDASGELVARYRKLHLFDVVLPDGTRHHESHSTTPGEAVALFDWEGTRVGSSICYDLRFPSLYSTLASEGAELLLVTAAFTEQTGMAHWQTLLRARAIENTAYVAAAAQWGSHPGGRRTFGHSCIVDPWGETIAMASEGEGHAVGFVDRAYLGRVRQRLPCLAHRRSIS
jgi:predicted amidohydrolase